uniref:DDE Tnp4 domain-containing protein n=1 Tax=Myripristis murdjan TaxID=586833 RepID=A0A667ZBL6_9TELE
MAPTAVLRWQRVLRERLNPLDKYDDIGLYSRFRFPRAEIQRITDLLAADLQHHTDRNGALSPSLQVCLALRYFATGSFQNLVGDSIQVHKSTRFNEYVKFPTQQQNVTRQKLHQIAGFPDLLGCVDGTHVRIKGPKSNENDFVNRKGYHSINTQIVCDADLHDIFILKQSSLWRDYEAGRYPGRLLGDSGDPLRKWLMTTYLSPASVSEQRYSSAHTKTRNVVERCIGVLKNRWASLQRGFIQTSFPTLILLNILRISVKSRQIDIPLYHEDPLPTEAATVRAYLTTSYFG